jgi:hypothetical protein
MKFSADLLLKEHSEEATLAFVSGNEETVSPTHGSHATRLTNILLFVVSQSASLVPHEGDKLQLEITQRMPLDPSAVGIALKRSGYYRTHIAGGRN